MAFHVTCLITRKLICSCALGFRPNLLSGDAKNYFSLEFSKRQEFLSDPWFFRVTAGGTVQVPDPKLTLPPLPPVVHAGVADAAGAAVEAGVDEVLSAQAKRAVIQRRATVASMADEFDSTGRELSCRLVMASHWITTVIHSRACNSGCQQS